MGRGRGDVLALLPRLLGPDFPHEPFMELRSRLATERMEREGVPVKEGAREVLEFLQSRKMPLALATSTYYDRTMYRLEHSGLGRYFQAVVTGDQVSKSKPDPEIYRRPARGWASLRPRRLLLRTPPTVSAPPSVRG